MKKYLSMLILMCVLCACGPVYAADVELNILVPDEHVETVLAAFNAMAGRQIKIVSKSVIAFEYEAQQPGEKQKKFAERVLSSLFFGLIDLEAESDYKTRRNVALKSLVVAPKKVLSRDAIQVSKQDVIK